MNATLRLELEDDLIRVTSIMPGVFATNFIRNMDRSMVEAISSSVGGLPPHAQHERPGN